MDYLAKIQGIVGDKYGYVELRENKQDTAVLMFGTPVLHICIRAKSQYVESGLQTAIDAAHVIAEAYMIGNNVRIPLETFDAFGQRIVDFLRILYEDRRENVVADNFGCCNDFVRCSDVGSCLHADNADYLGCSYRRNLESGRIFYGKNKNIR